MAMLNLVVIVLSAAVVTSGLTVPSGYILDVKPVCGRSASGRPVVNILSDLDVRAVAKCVNGDVKFQKLDAANYRLLGSFSHRSAGCLFHNYRDTFKLEVQVTYGQPGSGVLSQQQIYTVSCTFDSNGKTKTKSHNLAKGLVRPREKLFAVSSAVSGSFFSVSLQDVRGRTIRGSLPLDKVVSLYIRRVRTYRGLAGIKPITCYAIGASNKKKFAFLRSGCGDGIVIPKNVGFTVSGTTARSPYFKAFHVEGDSNVVFQCSFAACFGSCNGNSCSTSRNPFK